jgi:hypothetical protein
MTLREELIKKIEQDLRPYFSEMTDCSCQMGGCGYCDGVGFRVGKLLMSEERYKGVIKAITEYYKRIQEIEE